MLCSINATTISSRSFRLPGSPKETPLDSARMSSILEILKTSGVGGLMKVNRRKLMQLIVFFAHHEAVKPLGKTKLLQPLYFTDVTHLRTAGEPKRGLRSISSIRMAQSQCRASLLSKNSISIDSSAKIASRCLTSALGGK